MPQVNLKLQQHAAILYVAQQTGLKPFQSDGNSQFLHMIRGSRGAPFSEGTLSPLRRYLKPLQKGGGGEGGGERGTEAPLRYLKGASKGSKVP